MTSRNALRPSRSFKQPKLKERRQHWNHRCVSGCGKVMLRVHYGPEYKKHRIDSHIINHRPTSSGKSNVSERANRSTQAKQVVWSKQTSERCKQTSEQMREWLSTSVCILGWSGPQCLHPFFWLSRYFHLFFHFLSFCSFFCVFPSFVFSFMAWERDSIWGSHLLNLLTLLCYIPLLFRKSSSVLCTEKFILTQSGLLLRLLKWL